MGSGLGCAERAELKTLAAISGGRVVSQWQPGVSHVVCGLDAEQRARHACSSGPISQLASILTTCQE